MPDPQTFSPEDITLTINGVRITGFMDGTFINAERDEDSYTKSTGGDGQTARVRNPNRSGFITFTLQQTSPSNDVLSAQNALDELTGAGTGAALVKDSSGNTVVGGVGWVRKPANVGIGKELEGREWTIDIASPMTMIVGGNVS